MSYGPHTHNPIEHDDHLSCDFGCDGEAMMERVEGHTVPLCGPCYSDKTEECAQCHTRHWIANMARVFRSSNLYCLDCASQHPVLILGRATELRNDERKGF